MYKVKNDKDIVKLINKVLIDKELKKVDIANKLNIPRQRVTNILNKKNISINDIIYLLNAINCDLYVDIIDNENSDI